jgi:hypothetical protein
MKCKYAQSAMRQLLTLMSISLAVALGGCAKSHRASITPLPSVAHAKRLAETVSSPKGHILTWQSQRGIVYWLERSTNLVDWTKITMEQMGTGSTQWATVQVDGPANFYRSGARAIPYVIGTPLPYQDPNREITMKHRGE